MFFLFSSPRTYVRVVWKKRCVGRRRSETTIWSPRPRLTNPHCRGEITVYTLCVLCSVCTTVKKRLGNSIPHFLKPVTFVDSYFCVVWQTDGPEEKTPSALRHLDFYRFGRVAEKKQQQQQKKRKKGPFIKDGINGITVFLYILFTLSRLLRKGLGVWQKVGLGREWLSVSMRACGYFGLSIGVGGDECCLSRGFPFPYFRFLRPFVVSFSFPAPKTLSNFKWKKNFNRISSATASGPWTAALIELEPIINCIACVLSGTDGTITAGSQYQVNDTIDHVL